MMRNAPEARPGSSASSLPGTMVLLALQLPALAALATATLSRPGTEPSERILTLAALGSACLAGAWRGARHLRIRSLRAGSPVCIPAGSRVPSRIASIVMLCVMAAAAALPMLPDPLPFLPAPAAAPVLLAASLALALLGRSRRTQYWFRTCAALDGRVVAYEDIESVIQIPWQGFDVRMRSGGPVLELRHPREDASRLLDNLKPVLTPYGIRIQTRSAGD